MRNHGPLYAYTCLALASAIMLPASARAAYDPAPDCSRSAGDRPRPADPIGQPDASIPVEHAIVFMLENHSFDNVLGKLTDPRFYGSAVDGIQPGQFNLDARGARFEPFHLDKDCVKDMDHSWDGSHVSWNGGANDGFVIRNDSKKYDGYRAMGYYDDSDYPLMYFLADRYAVADRFFASTLGPTHPNRFYLWTGTSFGRLNNKLPNVFKGGWKQKTIFERLDESGVSWGYYMTDISNIMFFTKFFLKNRHNFHPMRELKLDADANQLPQVVFVENEAIFGEEHPPFNFEWSQHELRGHLRDLISSPSWASSAIFLTYDEAGGNWDHVPPPRACLPDGIAPVRDKGEKAPGGFDRYGFRVPTLVISPWAKRHYVSHVTYDHTSILSFIERKFNVPPLTARDANADPMLDMFDFSSPDFSQPRLPRAPIKAGDELKCVFKSGYAD